MVERVVSKIMARNNSVQVFKGQWEELENAIFTDNNVALGTSSVDSFFIKPDGTELYILDDDVVRTFPLAIPYDPNSLGSLGNTFTVTDDPTPRGLYFKDDGTKMFVGGRTATVMLEYVVPIPFDVSSIVASPASLSLDPPVVGALFQITFSRDGDFLFVTNTDTVYSFPLPTPWDITSNVSNTSFDPPTLTNIFSITFKREGDKMYLHDNTANRIVEFDLSTVYDITTAVDNGNAFDSSPMTPLDIKFRSNGLEFFILDNVQDFMRLHLDDQWDISTASLFTNSVSTVDSQSIFWKPDGTLFLIVVSTAVTDRLDEFTMITRPWNQTDAITTATFSLVGIAETPRGIWVNPEGTICMIADAASDSIVQLDMSTGWSLSTMSDPGISVDLTLLVPGLNSPSGIAFTKDQLTFYVTDTFSDTVYQFTVPTKLDIANAAYTGNFLNLTSFGDITDIRLKPDDNLMYVSDNTGDNILLFRLPADGDVSNAVLLQTLPVGFLEPNLQGFFIRENDGAKLWVIGLTSNLVQSMDISSEFSNSLITTFGDNLVTNLGETLVHV